MISELSLQRGKPIDIGICKVYPLILGEIEEMGIITYNQRLSILMMDKSIFDVTHLSKEEIEEVNKITPYEVIILHCQKDKIMREMILNSFFVFLKEKVNFSKKGFFYIGKLADEQYIFPEQFEQIKFVIQKQNYLQTKKEEKQLKPADERTRLLMEKMQKAKEKVQKQKQEESLQLHDVIDIVSAYSNVNTFDVWNLTVYDLYRLYTRIYMWDEYHNNFALLPHVTDSGSLNMKHWGSKIIN